MRKMSDKTGTKQHHSTNRRIGLVFIFFLLISFLVGEGRGGALFSQSIASMGLPESSSHWNGKVLIDPMANRVFIEEQGQFKQNLAEDKINLPEPILYGINNPEFNAYFTKTGITFLFAKADEGHHEDDEKGITEENTRTNWEVLSLKWQNSNPAVLLSAKEKVSNYFTYGRFADNTQYDHVSAYKKLSYTSIYDGVDAEFELPEKGGIKYRFIVHAGFKIPAIAYQVEGAKKLFIDSKGDLHIEAEYKTLVDKAPDALIKDREIPISYNLSGNSIELITSQNSSLLEDDLVIDPWIIDPLLAGPGSAYDVQEDASGNIFIYGSPINNYQAKKYDPSGALQWTHTTSTRYYGDIAAGNSGSLYLTEGIGVMKKLDQTGAVVWSAPGGGERWRLDFNKSKTILASGGAMGVNLSKLDTANGGTSNDINYSLETRSIATDCNGDMYSLHVTFGGTGNSGVAASNLLRKTNANFTAGGSVGSGLLLDEVGNLYTEAECCMGINGIAIHGLYIYIYDGIHLRRFNKNTLTVIDSVIVPNGLFYSCGGIISDYCGDIYVGTYSTIEKYDMSLTHLSSIPAPNIVYDVLLAGNGDLLACGKSFVANLGPTCTAPLPLSAIATSTDVSCNNGTANVIANGGCLPYSYLWQPGGQTTALDSGLAPGTFTYVVNDAFCQSVTDSVIVLQATPFLLSPGVINNESCLNSYNGTATVNASGGAGPYSYTWNTNPVQTTQTATGLSAGTYEATAYDAGGCIDTVTITITVNSNPVVAFGPTQVCQGNPTQYNDSSTTASGNISSWLWDFGDLSPVDNTQNPTHIYTNAGSYNITLIVSNNFGCADTLTKPVQVYFNPIVGFTSANVCFGDTVYFLNTSTVDTSSSITSNSWVFGDGSPSSSLQNASHYYSASGTYSVILSITTTDGCSNAATIPVQVFDAPTSAFTFSNSCLSDSALFTNTSLNPMMGNINSWSWDFGDGTSLNTTQWSPGHLYAATGNYQVTLITQSSNLGCQDTLKDSISIFPAPVADFYFIDVCLNEAMFFTDSSNVSNGTIVSRSWDFGDSSPFVTVQNPNHIFTNSGTYLVTLIVTTNNGCTSTISKSVTIHPMPVVQYSTTNSCEGNSIQFTDASAIPGSDMIQSWTWNFGDGSPASNIQNPSYLYAAMGSYTVQLLVVSNFGCKDSISKISIVYPNPVVSFTADTTAGCELLCVSFQNSSSIATGTDVSWTWNFGDGSSSSNLENPNHCYSNDSVFSPEFFNVTLNVTSDSGCISTLTKNNYITVYPNPNAGFTVLPQTTSITDPVISITDLSTGANFWNWNFGDMDTSSSSDPVPHNYADTGIYTITLITSSLYNCKDTTHQTIIIEPDFLFFIPNAFTPNGDGINDTFSGKGINIKKYEMMVFDRWGNLIYKTIDINSPWNGKANNGTEIAQRDIYVYVIKVVDFKLIEHNYKGIVTLAK